MCNYSEICSLVPIAAAVLTNFNAVKAVRGSKKFVQMKF